MTLAETLRGLVRRWYIVVPGLLLAVAAALGAFSQIPPAYERSATRLLLPGLGTVPEGATNPYLFLGGLTQAADVLVRAVGGDETVGELVATHKGLEVAVTRDPTSSGPVILLTVTADSDADAATALDTLIEQSTVTLERLQSEQDVRPVDRITLTTLTASTEGTLQQRTRLVGSVGAGLVVAVLALVVAALVDGLARKKRARAGGSHVDPSSGDDLPPGGASSDAGGEPAVQGPARGDVGAEASAAGGENFEPPPARGRAEAPASVPHRSSRRDRPSVPVARPGRRREPRG